MNNDDNNQNDNRKDHTPECACALKTCVASDIFPEETERSML